MACSGGFEGLQGTLVVEPPGALRREGERSGERIQTQGTAKAEPVAVGGWAVRELTAAAVMQGLLCCDRKITRRGSFSSKCQLERERTHPLTAHTSATFQGVHSCAPIAPINFKALYYPQKKPLLAVTPCLL